MTTKTTTKTTKKTTTTKANKNTKTRINKVFNLLKSGKNITKQALTKSAYGEYNANNYKNTCRIISAIRAKGYDVLSVGNGKYKMN